MQNLDMGAEPSARAQTIVRRTYSRPLDSGGFESWDEIVARVVRHQRWLWQQALGDVPLNGGQEDELEELRRVLLTREGSVSGRTLWLGGTEVAKKRQASMFNPLLRSEKFVTLGGVKSFEDFEDGATTTVLTHLGNWKPAVVADAGVRPTLKLGLRRGRSTTEVVSSRDHTWITEDGERLQAWQLLPGMKLFAAPGREFYEWEFEEASAAEQAWWCYGFVYGDGALAGKPGVQTSRVRLCGSKARHLEKFKACGFDYSYPPSCNADPIVYTGKYQKELPEEGTSLKMVEAFLRGYLAADGSKKVREGVEQFVGVFASDPEAVRFLKKYLPAIGLYVLREHEEAAPTNHGIRKGTLLSLSTCQGMLWKVESVEEGADESCWCLTVEDDHSFVLPSGVVTGNCAYTKIETTNDVVDAFWLLLQGCGVGFEPVVGTLNGFTQPMKIRLTRSQRHLLEQKKGREGNVETVSTEDGEVVWKISIGDSAEAWAKAVGKLLAGKMRADVVHLDFSQIRPAGERLRGYGWISSGDLTFAPALEAIAKVLNKQASKLLTRIDILDVLNHLGTTLSSRRSAEIALVPWGDPEWEEFASAKKDFWLHDNYHRQQSNNSIMFKSRPGKQDLFDIFARMEAAGGSEPGFINMVEGKRRGPWISGVNPCAEILLPNKGFCNLVEINLSRFNGERLQDLWRVAEVLARANYRQTCVNLVDGVLQRSWHENNEFLRLCGVGVTGVAEWEFADSAEYWGLLKTVATKAAYGMADELGLPRPKAVTTVKPSGTLSKIMDTTEGVHKPLGKYIFNNVRFSKHDPYVAELKAANYKVVDDPSSQDAVLVTFPVAYDKVQFENVDGKWVNRESAIEQLNRYKLLMKSYVDHNCSVTISYSPDEVSGIVEWLHWNWDNYVGVSFLYRTDPTKTAADLGYLYLPQEVVDEQTYLEYAKMLRPLGKGIENGGDVAEDTGDFEIDLGGECAGGVCPVR